MLRVGIVDIDTTHPWAIANYINATEKAQVVAVSDSGETWPKEHVQEFARRLTPPAQVLENAGEMLGKVDAAMFCGNRYDLRVEQVRPFLDAGLPVYIDKPAVGTLSDVRQLEKYVELGARLLMGSSLPLCPELKEVWRRVSAGSPCGVTVVGWRSLLEYGIHATDAALNIMQSYPQRVRWGAFGPTECVWAELANGQDLLLYTGLAQCQWQVTCMTADGLYSTMLNLGAFRGSHYDLLAQAFVEMAQTGLTRIPPRWHLEGIKLLIAAKRSRDESRTVALEELQESDGFDGQEYAEAYRAIASQAKPDEYLSPDRNVLLRRKSQMGFAGSAGLLGKIGGRAVSKAKRIARRVLGPKGTKFVKSALGGLHKK
jgi:hypothetical protein